MLKFSASQQLIKANLRALNLTAKGIGYEDGDENKDGSRGQPACHDMAYAKGSFACVIKCKAWSSSDCFHSFAVADTGP